MCPNEVWNPQKSISAAEVVSSLQRAGVQKGDTLCVHSFLGAFGRFENGMETVFNGLISAIGPEGTLVVPTFNYDFCQGHPYNHDTTPSQVGAFTEFCRTHFSGKRTFHPVYSHVVFGKNTSRYLANSTPSGFGKNTVFDILHSENATLVYFGLSMNYATFIHHIEDQLQVPYRFLKNFSGDVTKDGKTFAYTASIYSRYLEFDPPAQPWLLPLQTHLLDKGLAKKSILGRGEIIAVHAKDCFNEAVKKYKENTMYFIKNPVDLSQIPLVAPK